MPNLNSIILNELTALTSQMPRLEASLVNDLKRSFALFQSEMLAEVARFDVTGVNAMSYREKRAIALIESVKDITATAYRDFSKQTERELLAIANVTSGSYISIVNSAVQAELLTKTLDSEQLRYLVKNSVIDGATSKEWWAKQAKDTQFKFNNAIQDGIIKGEPIDIITRNIRGTKALNYNDGFMNTAYRNARSLTQTSVANVANAARIETIQANDDVVDGIQWVATLDGRTTQICRSLDGKVWDLNYNPIKHSQLWPGTTAHWNERSTQIGYIKAFDKLPAAKRKALEGTRASIDGQIAESVNYNDWLRTKNKTNPAFVKETLGSGKYKIWLEKDLTMTDMVSQSNNPLTVAQLKAKFN